MQKVITRLCFTLSLVVFSIFSSLSQTTTCAKPNISSIVPDSTSVLLVWLNSGTTTTASTYTIQVTAAPVTTTSTWLSINSNVPSTLLTGLLKCKEYAIRVKKNCSATLSSDWSDVKTFKTTGCVVNAICLKPSLTSLLADSTKLTVSWTASTTVGATYTLQYTTAPATTASVWTSISSTLPSKIITGLLPCKEYVVRVKTNCSATLSSDWSDVKTIKTKGCALPCLKPIILGLTADSTKATVSWSASTTVGSTYTLQYILSPATTTSVWTSVTSTTPSTIVTGLTTCKEYAFRVRTNCSAILSSDWSEVKVIKTKGCALPCVKPTWVNLTADSTKITATWSAATTTGATYTVQYTPSPLTTTSVWTSVTSTMPTVTITGLALCKEYIVRIQTNCGGNNLSDWSEAKVIKTKGCALPCVKPVLLSSVADSTTVTLAWIASTTLGSTYTVQYTAIPTTSTSVWTSVTSTTATTTITGLALCKEYAFRVKTNCSANLSSDWSEVKVIKTKGCALPCVKPTWVSLIVDSSKATASWTPSTTLGSTYTVQYTLAPVNTTSVWTSVTSTTANTTITGLALCKEYAFRVKTNCSAALSGDWSEVKVIKTKGCALPCVKPLWVSLIADSSKATASWTPSTTLGSTYTVQYTLAPVTTTSVWTSVTSTTATTTITGLALCKEYAFRIQTNCGGNSLSDWSEVKVIKTKGCSLPCVKPTWVSLLADSTKATATWLASTTTGSTYTVQYTLAPVTTTSVWTSVTSTTATTTVTGLALCKEYAFRVRTSCATDYFSDWSEVKKVKTKGCIVYIPCLKPSKLLSTTTNTTVNLSWAGTTKSYQVRYSLKNSAGTLNWITVDSIKTLNTTISNLAPCSQYYWQVRGLCDNGGWTEWVGSSFSVAGCSNSTSYGLLLSPNPGSYLNVDYSVIVESDVTIEIVNLMGMPVDSRVVGKQIPGKYKVTFDNPTFADGMYFILLKINGKTVAAQRWEKKTI